MSRVFIVVLDSLGIGAAPDADQYFCEGIPDTGANTLGHIAQWYEKNARPLALPNLCRIGLGDALFHSSGLRPKGMNRAQKGAWASAREVSKGKDTPSGHWEIAGHPVTFDWHYFNDKENSFPPDLHRLVENACGRPMLGNCHAPGTAIIERLGAAHMQSGRPICYTSVDSVFQIAAHEETFGLQALYDLCAEIAPHLHAQQVGRVIARPFMGDQHQGFVRSTNRRDYALKPPKPLLCQWAHDEGRAVIGIGKTSDIFAHQGFSQSLKGADADLMTQLKTTFGDLPQGGLCFANFVEFDSLYGHRRDPRGYGAHLEWFDRHLGEIFALFKHDDLLIVTADHGNDPTWHGTDHTREQVPVLMYRGGDNEAVQNFGAIAMSDIAAQAAQHLNIHNHGAGRPIGRI